MNLYRYLIEMSNDKKEIERNIINHLDEIIEHLIRAILIQNKTNNLNHWEHEIYAQLHRLPKVSGKNKRFSANKLQNLIYKYYEDTIKEDIPHIINDINYQEKDQHIDKYDIDKLIYLIHQYFLEITPTLSNIGRLEESIVHDIIDNLIIEYNK